MARFLKTGYKNYFTQYVYYIIQKLAHMKVQNYILEKNQIRASKFESQVTPSLSLKKPSVHT